MTHSETKDLVWILYFQAWSLSAKHTQVLPLLRTDIHGKRVKNLYYEIFL